VGAHRRSLVVISGGSGGAAAGLSGCGALFADERRAGVWVAPAASSAASGCRLHHRSGWMIECAELPEASWLQALVQGGEHAAT